MSTLQTIIKDLPPTTTLAELQELLDKEKRERDVIKHEKRLLQKKKYRETHREEILQKHREYRELNREKINESRRVSRISKTSGQGTQEVVPSQEKNLTHSNDE